MIPDLTARTRLGAVDMVPLLRRLDGDRSVDIPTHERHAAVLALRSLGVSTDQIIRASGLGASAVEQILSTERDRQAVERKHIEAAVRVKETQRRGRAARLAQRIEVNGRLIHPYAPRHGSNSVYNAYGCRCGPCSRAHTEEQRRARGTGA